MIAKFITMLRNTDNTALLAVTGRLPARLRARKQAQQATAQRLAERLAALENHASATHDIVARAARLELNALSLQAAERLALLESAVAATDDLRPRLATLEQTAETQRAAMRLAELENLVTAMTDVVPRLATLEQTIEEQQAAERLTVLESHAAATANVLPRLATLERAADRLAALEQALAQAELQSQILAEQHRAIAHTTAGQIAALENSANALPDFAAHMHSVEARFDILFPELGYERNRLDWALASIAGVTNLIDDYHSYRHSKDYLAAFTCKEPLVSVCVPTMDRAELLLDRAIASLRAQTYNNLQIIVVGDNCTDDTAARLAALADPRIEFVNLPERGPYPHPGQDRWCVAGTHAFNRALSLCKGQFVTHLDDDDAMPSHAIATLVAAAQQQQADFIWHPFEHQDQAGNWLVRGNGRLEFTQVTTGSIFYHHYFTQIPWDVTAYRLNEPGDWNRLRKIKALRPRLHYVDEPLLRHFKEQGQAPFVARNGERFLE